jgi:DNA-binding transcriptional ArsR family regulator
MAGTGTASSQQEVLNQLMASREGLTLDEISASLGLSRTAINQHLMVLEREGHVRRAAPRKTGGRPLNVYVLTEEGINLFPKQYSWFSKLLFQTLPTAGTLICTVVGSLTRVQVEAGAFASPWIDTAGTTVTRAATNLSIPGTFLRANDFGVMQLVIPGASGQVGVVFDSWMNSSNYTSILAPATTTFSYRKLIGGVSIVATDTYTHTTNTPFLYQAYQSSVYGMGIRVRQYSGGVWGAWSAWATKDDADGRLDAPIAATVQTGARNNTNHFAGNYPGVLSVLHNDPRAELERIGALIS